VVDVLHSLGIERRRDIVVDVVVVDDFSYDPFLGISFFPLLFQTSPPFLYTRLSGCLLQGVADDSGSAPPLNLLNIIRSVNEFGPGTSTWEMSLIHAICGSAQNKSPLIADGLMTSGSDRYRSSCKSIRKIDLPLSHPPYRAQNVDTRPRGFRRSMETLEEHLTMLQCCGGLPALSHPRGPWDLELFSDKARPGSFLLIVNQFHGDHFWFSSQNVISGEGRASFGNPWSC
jgi:hypothetical protein